MSAIIKKPNVYITPDLLEGENCSVHIITLDQTFIALKFEEGDLEIPFKPFIKIDDTFNLEVRPKIKKQISKLEDRIVNLGSIFTCYNYLLTVKDNEVFLLSISLSGISLGFNITQEIATKVKIPTYNPIFRGPFTDNVINVFVEDAFFQKQ